MNKIIRQQIRTLRKQLTHQQQQQFAADLLYQVTHFNVICDLLLTHKLTSVALYLSDDGEIDPIEIIKLFWTHQVDTYLPIIDDKNPKEPLKFQHFQSQTKLMTNKYKILEPSQGKTIPINQLDLIFIPLVAFDEQCNRLGRGKGYYDRALAHCYDLTSCAKPISIGLAHDFQLSHDFQINSFDIPLDFILTPTQVYHNK